jgi:glycosyltransferase involved in cell wall biosynthesis
MRIVLCKGQVLGPISGADETLVTYAVQLQKAGHSVSVLLMYRSGKNDPYAQRLLDSGVPIAWIASKFAHKSLGTARKLGYQLLGTFPASKQFIRNGGQRMVTGLAGRNYEQCRDYLKRQNADLMHIITPDPSAMVMIRAGHDAGVPVIYQELGLPYHPPDFASYYREFTTVLRLCSEVAALSPKLVEYCREKLPISSRLSVLPIMSDEISNGNGARPRANGQINFGFAARLEELKGPIVLMEAFAATRDHVPDVRLKLAGEGSQRKQLAALAQSLGVADHYDYNGVYKRPEERTSFMHDLDVFVLPSFTEGTPNSIVEAMANGKPIIASAVGGIPDMIDDQSGILVPPGDPRALAKAMIVLAKNPELRRRMGEAALKRYRLLFSPRVVVPLMLETYARVAGGAQRRESTAVDQSSHPWSLCH